MAGATLLNPHFAIGTKDQDGSRIFYEPLAAFDPEGNLVPILAAEIPSVQNGGVARDGRSVTWKLKKGVVLARRQALHRRRRASSTGSSPRDPATAATHDRHLQGHRQDRRSSTATPCKVVFKKPVPFWADAFCGVGRDDHPQAPVRGLQGRQVPRGADQPQAGRHRPLQVRGLQARRHRAGRALPRLPHAQPAVLRHHRDEGRRRLPSRRPARSIQTGEFDYAWNMQVEDEILLRMEQGGKGKADIVPGGNIEHIQINFTDPWKDVDGERSSLKTTHPFLTDPAVRQALSLLVDRASVQEQIYGRTGITTANFLNAPARFSSKNTKWEFNVDKAKPDPGGRGLEEGQRRHPGQGRQEAQDRVPDVDQRARARRPRPSSSRRRPRRASTWRSSRSRRRCSSPPTWPTRTPTPHFYTDIQMYTTTMTSPDPELFMLQFTTVEVATKDNKWQGRNITAVAERGVRQALPRGGGRARPGQARRALHQDERPRDPERGGDPGGCGARRGRGDQQAHGHEQSGWDSDFWNLRNWYREA